MTTQRPLAPEPPLALDQRSRECMDAYMRASRLGEDLTRAILAEPIDPVIAQNLPFIVLAGLYLDGPMRPTAIGALTGLTSGGVSGLLERLEAAGLVARSFGQVSGDRRGVVVRLTDKGREDLLVVARLLDWAVEKMLGDLNGLIEQRDRRGVTRPAPPIILPVDDTASGAATALSLDPEAAIRERTRENLHVFLWFVRKWQGIMRPIIERLHDHAFDQAVPMLAMYALLVHGSMRPSEIAATTGISSGGVSGLLERLEGAGLVTREFGLVPGDRRGVVVRLTEKGREGTLIVVAMVADPMDDLLNRVAATNALRAHRRATASVAGAPTGI